MYKVELKTRGAIHLGPERPSFLASQDKIGGYTRSTSMAPKRIDSKPLGCLSGGSTIFMAHEEGDVLSWVDRGICSLISSNREGWQIGEKLEGDAQQ